LGFEELGICHRHSLCELSFSLSLSLSLARASIGLWRSWGGEERRGGKRGGEKEGNKVGSRRESG